MESLNPILVFEYTNYKGERSVRRIIPNRIEFGCTPKTSEPCWLLIGYDLDKKASRSFVMEHILCFIESEHSKGE